MTVVILAVTLLTVIVWYAHEKMNNVAEVLSEPCSMCGDCYRMMRVNTTYNTYLYTDCCATVAWRKINIGLNECDEE